MFSFIIYISSRIPPNASGEVAKGRKETCDFYECAAPDVLYSRPSK